MERIRRMGGLFLLVALSLSQSAWPTPLDLQFLIAIVRWPCGRLVLHKGPVHKRRVQTELTNWKGRSEHESQRPCSRPGTGPGDPDVRDDVLGSGSEPLRRSDDTGRTRADSDPGRAGTDSARAGGDAGGRSGSTRF